MGNRTPDLFIANETLYQLSYGPECESRYANLVFDEDRMELDVYREWAIQDLNL